MYGCEFMYIFITSFNTIIYQITFTIETMNLYIFNYTFKSCTMIIFYSMVLDSHDRKFYCSENHLTRSFIVQHVSKK